MSFYRVKAGDSVGKIAKRFTGSPRNGGLLVKANPHKPTMLVYGDPTFRVLKVAEIILLPTGWGQAGGLGVLGALNAVETQPTPLPVPTVIWNDATITQTDDAHRLALWNMLLSWATTQYGGTPSSTIFKPPGDPTFQAAWLDFEQWLYGVGYTGPASGPAGATGQGQRVVNPGVAAVMPTPDGVVDALSYGNLLGWLYQHDENGLTMIVNQFVPGGEPQMTPFFKDADPNAGILHQVEVATNTYLPGAVQPVSAPGAVLTQSSTLPTLPPSNDPAPAPAPAAAKDNTEVWVVGGAVALLGVGAILIAANSKHIPMRGAAHANPISELSWRHDGSIWVAKGSAYMYQIERRFRDDYAVRVVRRGRRVSGDRTETLSAAKRYAERWDREHA